MYYLKLHQPDVAPISLLVYFLILKYLCVCMHMCICYIWIYRFKFEILGSHYI